MKIVVAVDSFKGSLTSIEVGNAVKEGILAVCDAEVVVKPLADGGEGTVSALVSGTDVLMETAVVTGPLMGKRVFSYAILKESNTAVIEVASIAGLTLVPENLKNPLNTTTYGVGEAIKNAIAKGCRKFIIGIGGSSTNDGGVGMLQALGFDFFDAKKNQIGYGGKFLSEIRYISDKNKLPELDQCSFRIACDVNNPLFGEFGASNIFGPQKGATKDMIRTLDNGLMNLSFVTQNTFNVEFENEPGAGAAGGMGYGFMAFLHAKLESGIDIILDEIKIEDELKDADFVITGEGRIDDQTTMGKAPIGVAKRARAHGVTVIAITGCIADNPIKCNQYGIDAIFPVISRPMSIEEAMDKDNAKQNVINMMGQIFRLIETVNKKKNKF